jgi:hypothetical protein
LRAWISPGTLRRSGSISPSGRRGDDSTIAVQRVILTSRLLLLKSGCPGFDKGILDAAGDFNGKDRSWVQRAWHRLLPSLQHFVELLPSLRVDECVGIHECGVEVAAQE